MKKIKFGIKKKTLLPLVIGGLVTLLAAITCLSYSIQKFGDGTMDYTMVQNLSNLTDNQISIDIISNERFDGVYKDFKLNINETDYFDFSSWCNSEQVRKKENNGLFFAAGYNYDRNTDSFVLAPEFKKEEYLIQNIDADFTGEKSGIAVPLLLLKKGSARFNAKVDGKQICYLTVAEPDTTAPRMILIGQVSSLDSDLATYLIILQGLILLIISTIVIMIIWKIDANIVQRIGRIDDYLRQVSKSDFPDEKLVVDTKDELSETAAIINNMVVELKDKHRMETELNAAANIQLGMLPTDFTAFSDNHMFDLYATIQTAKEVGGDFYDFFMVDDTHLAIVMADVSGKGVPAALFMVMGKTVMRSLIRTDMQFSRCMTDVNKILCANNENGLFITCWAGIIDLETGILTFTNAGHNPPLLMRNSGEYEYVKNLHGLVLGGFDTVKYKEDKLHLNIGDRLFLYTDGITEAQNDEGEMYDEERLLNCLNKNKTLSPRELLVAVKEDVDEFVGGVDQFDDQTMMSVIYENNSAK